MDGAATLLTSDLATAARDAFQAGWILTAPPGECTEAQLDAAAAVAEDFADDPGVLEATLKLGQLQGIYATVYARQDDLYDQENGKARKIWAEIIASLALAALLASFRRIALAGADPHPAALKALAAAFASAMLAGITTSALYAEFLTELTAALTAAAGEGHASALAVAAAQAGHTGFDWDQAAQDGQRDPGPDIVAALAAAIIAGAITDLAATMAAAVIVEEPGATATTAAGLLAAIMKAMNAARSVKVYLTHGMTGAVSAAMQGVYDQAGVILLNFITAGDDRVCPECDAIEKDNPYLPGLIPAPPRHVNCRCITMPAHKDAIPYDSYVKYL
jgi:hypothetical protein